MQANTMQTTIPTTQISDVPQIRATKNYDMFKLIPGNRKIYVSHVNALTKEVAKQNLLAQFPILVNKQMEIIDGQHRLEVAKNNKLTIYYMVIDGGDLPLIQSMNSSVQAWNGNDYLESYIALGNPHYKKLKQYIETYKLSIHILLILATQSGGKVWSEFKRGVFQIPDEEELENNVMAYMKVRPYAISAAWKDREFILAFKRVLQETSVEELLARFEASGYKIDRCVAQRDYLREFERVINFKKQNTVRLF